MKMGGRGQTAPKSFKHMNRDAEQCGKRRKQDGDYGSTVRKGEGRGNYVEPPRSKKSTSKGFLTDIKPVPSYSVIFHTNLSNIWVVFFFPLPQCWASVIEHV